MTTDYKKYLWIALCILTIHCTIKKRGTTHDHFRHDSLNYNKAMTGFNQNFSMMPNLTATLCERIKQLQPKLLRYPGGTVTHSWNWKTGTIQSRKSTSTHPIDDIKTLVDYTHADFVFVLDLINSSIDDQIEMLTSIEKLGVPIKYIELGNELYAQEKNYEKNFPSGKDYALKVNQWIPLLKKQFPHAQVSALLLGRQVQESNQRMYHWNTQVIEPTFASVDAYTYHIYINENKTFEEEKNEFIEVTKKSNTKDKPLWITEYGNNQDKSKDSYYIELLKLADFVEQFPHVAIALNHQLIGGTKNKITEDGKDFVKEGFYFLERVKK